MVWDGSGHGGFTAGTPWLPVKAPQMRHAVEAQRGVEGSALETYRAMIALRRSERSLRLGAARFLDVEEPVLAFRRGEDVLCVFNLSPEPREAEVGAVGEVLMAQDAVMAGGVVRLGPNGALVARV